jgi:single-stranded-DNA-specific exonuclease
MHTTLAPPRRRWIFPDPTDCGAARRLVEELRLPDPLCRLLVQRGVIDTPGARAFLRPHAGQIHSPLLLAGAEPAIERLRTAIDRGERILVHGDYDVDGICTTALYVRALFAMGADVVPFVPHRLKDGYDLTEVGVRIASAQGARVILTGDCGIVAHEAVRRAAAAGIDVIVTDHHTPGASLPEAAAVIDPQRADCAYPDKGLAGVGVAYKVCCALAGAVGFPLERLTAYLDLVALATVADLAPLTGENRVLVRWGLRVLARTPNPGLRALLRATGLEGRDLSAGQVGFILAPRINAVGRMGDAMRGVRLLLTDDPREAEAIAATLEIENRARQEVEAETLDAALRMLERYFDPVRDHGVVLAKEGWHPGVIGIVASRVVERIHRPTVLIALGGVEGKGSARSIPGFHLYDAMRDCSEHLTRFGGHRAAAGCSIQPERVATFREAFEARARSALAADDLVPELRIDLEVGLDEVDLQLHRVLRHAGPFGMKNPTPVFAARGVRVSGRPRLVGRGHLKLSLVSDTGAIEAIGFGMGDRIREIDESLPLDVAFKVEENTYRGITSVQARLVDLRESA